MLIQANTVAEGEKSTDTRLKQLTVTLMCEQTEWNVIACKHRWF